MRRNRFKPVPKLSFWIVEGDLFFADKEGLEKALSESGNSQDTIRKRMGFGYHHLVDALNGKGLSCWAANHVEWGLQPEEAILVPNGREIS